MKHLSSQALRLGRDRITVSRRNAPASEERVAKVKKAGRYDSRSAFSHLE